MQRVFLIAVATMLLLSTVSASAETVTVGLFADYTGALATRGSQLRHGVEAYPALHGNTVNRPDEKPVETRFVCPPRHGEPRRRQGQQLARSAVYADAGGVGQGQDGARRLAREQTEGHFILK